MDKQQFATLAIAIKSAYPASKILDDNPSMDFWYAMLGDIDYKVAENAIMEHICTNVFPPNIAEIRKLCTERTMPLMLSADEAWGVVQNAMSRYGFYNPEEAFETMDEITLSVVKNLGWSRLCQSENSTADRANFRMAYEAKVKDRQNANQLPQFVGQQKLLLQQQYVPAIEQKPAQRIEQQDTPRERIQLTDEQIAERERQMDELRRRIKGG